LQIFKRFYEREPGRCAGKADVGVRFVVSLKKRRIESK